jgi:hypothetical protein
MGGWISLLLAGRPRHRKQVRASHCTALHCTALHCKQVRALLLVAPALNFFRPHYARLAASLPEEAVRRLDRGEVHVLEDETGVTHLRKSFAERSAELELDCARGLEVVGPCRILHGVRDASVAYTGSVQLMEALQGDQVRSRCINLTTTQPVVAGTHSSAIKIGRHIWQIILQEANCGCRHRHRLISRA